MLFQQKWQEYTTERIVSPTAGTEKSRPPHAKEFNWTLSYIKHKNQRKVIKDLNLISETIKLEESTGEIFMALVLINKAWL